MGEEDNGPAVFRRREGAVPPSQFQPCMLALSHVGMVYTCT